MLRTDSGGLRWRSGIDCTNRQHPCSAIRTFSSRRYRNKSAINSGLPSVRSWTNVLNSSGKSCPGYSEREITLDIVPRQKLQGDFAANTACLQFQLERSEKMFTERQVGRPVGQ